MRTTHSNVTKYDLEEFEFRDAIAKHLGLDVAAIRIVVRGREGLNSEIIDPLVSVFQDHNKAAPNQKDQ